jgi:hypothetical protein
MQLNEVLNKPYDLRVTSTDHLNWSARFTTDDNIDYAIYIENDYSAWEVTFKANAMDAAKMDKSPVDILNTGNAFRVFATVLYFVQKFIEKIEPQRITFSAKEPSRQKLYSALIKKFSRKLGYSATSKGSTFFMTKRN